MPPVVLVLVAIASVQVGSSFAKDLFSSAPPVAVAWLRLVVGAVVLAAIARPRLRGRPAAEWRTVLAYGLVMAAMNLSFYLAIQRIPIGTAVTVEFLGPLGVAVAGSRRVRDFVWVALAGLGVVLLGFTPGDLDLVGVALAALAGALWAGYIVLAGPVGRAWSGVTGVTVATWVGSLALVAPALVTGLTLAPGTGAAAPAVSGWLVDPRVWLLGAAVGVLSSVIPYGLEMIALRTVDRGVFGILMSLEPAAAALFAFLLLGESLQTQELVAMGCVIAASLGATRSARAAG